MPDAVRAKHIACLIDQHVEGQAGFLDVVLDRLTRLREYADDLNAARSEVRQMRRKLTKLVAAVRSPGAPMEREQQRASSEQFCESPRASFLIRKRELRRAREP